MAILPNGSVLTVQASGFGYNTINLIIDELNYTRVSEPFQRLEYSYQFLKDKLNSDGSNPLYVTGFGNVPSQITSTCSSVTARNLAPDDAQISNISRKWVIQRFNFSGGPSLATEVDKLYVIAQQHQLYLDQFNLHLQKLQQPLSYDYFVAMQAETFSNITTTGVSMTANVFSNSTIWNIFLTNFQASIAYEVPGSNGLSGSLVKNWSCEIQVRQNLAASATSS